MIRTIKIALTLAMICASATGSRAQGPAVFINEFHYDNTGVDTGEFVEIAGPAGTNLAGYQIVPYNGANGQSYTPAPMLSGTIPNQQNGYGTISVPVAGLQNGSPDGIALIGPGNVVIQFLSYEGSFTAAGGPASGRTSTEIPVAQAGTEPANTSSLHLQGTGTVYTDFVWAATTTAASPGAVNSGQTFGQPLPALSVGDATVIETDGEPTTAAFTVTLSTAVHAGVTFDIATADGVGANAASTADNDYQARSQAGVVIPSGQSSYTFEVTVNGDTQVEADEAFRVLVSGVVGATVADGEGVGTIQNDDVPPTPVIAISDAAIAEGDSGIQHANFLVSLTSPAGPAGVSFTVATSDVTATAAVDYDAVSEGFTIPAGHSSFTVSVPVRGDTDREPNETFTAAITSASGADIGDGEGVGTILNDDLPGGIVINEIDSDTEGTDALEFVELYDGGAGNTPLDGFVVVFYNGATDGSYAAFDLDGRTTDARGYFVLGNAAVPGVDLIFPGNLLQNGADAVALYAGNASSFPGNTPVTTANLIDAVVYDTADDDDTGLLVLLNPGQPQVNEAGAAGGSPANSLQRCHNGEGGARNTAAFEIIAPTPKAANGPCLGPAMPFTIAEIQGPGFESPYLGQHALTSGVVTGRRSNGFFLQSLTPDSSEQTSEGVFVFTNGTPRVAESGALRVVEPGDVVEVTGRIAEFFASTQLSTPVTVSLLREGEPLPPAVALDGLFSAEAADDFDSREDQLERYENMLARVGALRVVAPTNGFGELYAVLDGVDRPFREPGVETGHALPAGSPPNVPMFDGNFERIMVESDEQIDAGGVRRAPIQLSTGATLAGAEGPLDYTFGEYRISLPAGAAPGTTDGIAAAVPVRAAAAHEFAIGSANLQNFSAENSDRLAKAVLYVQNVLRAPAVLGLIEIVALNDLQRLADAVNASAGTSYRPYLLPSGTQNTGFLVDEARAQVLEGPTQLFAGDQWTYHGEPDTLHDRPPLVMKVNLLRPGTIETLPVTVMLLHLKALIDVDSIAPYPPSNPIGTLGERNRIKRRLAAEDVADAIGQRQHENLVVLGDLNAFEFNDGYVDVVGTLAGSPAPADQVVEASADRWDHQLFNLIEHVAPAERYSYLFGGSAQVLDHVLVNAPMLERLTGVSYARNNADFQNALATVASRPERVADHDAPVAYFSFPRALAVDDATVVEPGLGVRPAVFTLRLSSPSPAPVTVLASTADGSASAWHDYVPRSATVTFPAGATTASFEVLVIGDVVDESDETFFVNLSNAAEAQIADARAAGTIVDSDPLPNLYISDATIGEGDAGVKHATFYVVMAPFSSADVTVAFTTADGSALAGSDYVTTSGVLTFTPGSLIRTISVPVVGDTAFESDEQFHVRLSDPSGAALADGAAVGRIVNDDRRNRR